MAGEAVWRGGGSDMCGEAGFGGVVFGGPGAAAGVRGTGGRVVAGAGSECGEGGGRAAAVRTIIIIICIRTITKKLHRHTYCM